MEETSAETSQKDRRKKRRGQFEGDRSSSGDAFEIRGKRINRKSIAVRCRRKIFLISGEATIRSSYPTALAQPRVYRKGQKRVACVYKGNHLVLKLHGNLSQIGR